MIFGFGRVGNDMADYLSQEGFQILGMDKDIQQVNMARAKSSPVFFGDATTQAALNAMNLDKALCAVITLDDAEATRQIVRSIRNGHKHIPLIVRAHSKEDLHEFESYENVDAISEQNVISSKLSEKVLGHVRLVDNEEAVHA